MIPKPEPPDSDGRPPRRGDSATRRADDVEPPPLTVGFPLQIIWAGRRFTAMGDAGTCDTQVRVEPDTELRRLAPRLDNQPVDLTWRDHAGLVSARGRFSVTADGTFVVHLDDEPAVRDERRHRRITLRLPFSAIGLGDAYPNRFVGETVNVSLGGLAAHIHTPQHPAHRTRLAVALDPVGERILAATTVVHTLPRDRLVRLRFDLIADRDLDRLVSVINLAESKRPR